MRKPQCAWCEKYSSWLTFSGNTLNGLLQIVIGLMTTSQALVADGLHSVADAMTNIVTIGTLQVSQKPHDKCHPYGHGKVEFIASAFFGLMLIILSVGIMIRAIVSIIKGDMPPISYVALLPAVISILVNVSIANYGLCVGHEMKSPVVIANAKENLADAYAAIASLVGIIGALVGYPWLDRLAALLVAVLIGRMGIEVFHQAAGGLMDSSIETDSRRTIRRLARSVPGVEAVVSLKTRHIGQKTWADLGIAVSPTLPLYEADRVANDVRNTLMREFEELQNAVVYLNPHEPVEAPEPTLWMKVVGGRFGKRNGVG